jgi:hypothetical protein
MFMSPYRSFGRFFRAFFVGFGASATALFIASYFPIGLSFRDGDNRQSPAAGQALALVAASVLSRLHAAEFRVRALPADGIQDSRLLGESLAVGRLGFPAAALEFA